VPPSLGLGLTRLVSQRILGSSFEAPEEAMRWMLAMQAQDFGSARWSLGLRARGATEARVLRSFREGHIVRSWPLRGTLHVTAAEDVGWLLELGRVKILAATARRRAALDLDAKTLERARSIAVAALSGGKELGREALLAELTRRGVPAKGPHGYHILFNLSLTGTLLLGPSLGKVQTYVLLDEWVKRPRRLEREEALGELSLRYFVSHGPATPLDLSRWAKLTMGEVRTGLALARASLSERSIDGVTYFMAADAEDRLAGIESAAKGSWLLLPGFDEYVLGYADRSSVLAKEHSDRVVPGGNGVFLPTVVSSGNIVGTWRRVAKARESVVQATPFAKKWTAAATKGIARAAHAYGQFLGVPVRVGEKTK
jgi:hypothetical protein